MASKRRETWGAKENSTVFKNEIKSLIQHCEQASYVYILSGQKFMKIAKNSQFEEFLKMRHF